jgi:hypothetical protein
MYKCQRIAGSNFASEPVIIYLTAAVGSGDDGKAEGAIRGGPNIETIERFCYTCRMDLWM